MTVVEREARFLVADPAVHRSVARLTSLGSFRMLSRRRERQRNTYFDTDDMRLWRAKSVLKLRETRAVREVTFKKAISYRDGVASRLEVTSRIRPEQRVRMKEGAWSIAPMRRARAIIATHRLHPLFVVATNRTTLILDRDGQKVELDVDRVAVRRGRQVAARRLEIEVENLTASPAVFRSAIAALRRRYGAHLRLSGVSKFAFGLRVTRARKRR